MSIFGATTDSISRLLGIGGTRHIPPNTGTGTGGGGAPVEPPNAFHGKPERVPQVVFVRERTGDGFLTSARTYYQLFGLDVRMIDSVAQIVSALAGGGQRERIAIVSHAHPRGMIIPFFTGGVRGTNKEIFREFAKSDLDGLKLLLPLNHLFDWDSIMSFLMTLLRGRPNATARLQPFGLETSSTPQDTLREFFRFCFDIVYVNNPGRVRRNAAQTGGLSAGQRLIYANFIREILRQMSPGIESSSITATQVEQLRDFITAVTYAQMQTVANLGNSHPQLGLNDDSMNDFPTLQAVVPALTGGFRANLTAARQRISAATIIDVRGCRAGDDEDYIEAIREFFGRGDQKPTVTAPRWFQSYPEIDRRKVNDRADLQSWISATQWGNSSAELKTAFRNWAELIRVTPLHTDFWRDLLHGQAVRFASLSWRSQIPALFIPTPGLTELDSLTFAQVIGKLKDYLNVPAAAVPSSSTLSGLATLTSNLATWSSSLLTPAADSATPAQRTTLFQSLQQINTALSQSFVPATSPHAPDPPTAAELRGFQTQLVNFLENKPELDPVKTFMTAAAASLETGDGLFHYLVSAGLPVYVHGIPQLTRNGLVVLNAHRVVALQSWYKCLWKDPLPSSGTYTTASIDTLAHRQVTGLVGDDRHSFISICPIPRYMNCIRKRPMPPDEDESLCGS